MGLARGRTMVLQRFAMGQRLVPSTPPAFLIRLVRDFIRGTGRLDSARERRRLGGVSARLRIDRSARGLNLPGVCALELGRRLLAAVWELNFGLGRVILTRRWLERSTRWED